MSRRATIAEMRWPETPEFVAAASQHGATIIADIIEALWVGYDRFHAEVIVPLGHYDPGDEMERNLTQLLFPHVKRAMTGYEPYYVAHGHRENESRAPAPAQAPEYDLAFVLNANPRVCWPAEAKFLRTDKTVKAYADEIDEQYLTCRYGPFSSSGAMLAYLLAGDPTQFLDNVEGVNGVPLTQWPGGRHHRTSDHPRRVPPGKAYPATFRCHHLVMPIRA